MVKEGFWGLTETDFGSKGRAKTAAGRLGPEINKKTKWRLQAWWFQVKETAKALCPIDTGTLRMTIRIEPKGISVGGAPTFMVTVSPEHELINSQIVAGGMLINPRTGRIVDYACFTKNNFVVSNPNTIQIPNLRTGDRIYSNGSYEKVTGIRERIYSGMFIRILRHKSNIPLELTKEHKIFAIKSVICQHHKGYNYTCRASCKFHNRTQMVHKNCEMFFENYIPEQIEANELKRGDYLISPRLKKVVDIEEINKKLCRLIGYFASDGNSFGEYYTRFWFTHPREQKYADDVNNLMENIFGTVSSKPHISNGSVRLCFCNKKANEFFSQFYNEKKDKYLPQWVLYLPYEKQKEIICGLFRGDAYKGKRRKRFGNTSRILSEQIRIILERLGFSPSFRIDKSYRKNRKDCFLVEITGKELIEFQKIIRDGVKPRLGRINRNYCIITDDYIAYPIRKIEKQYDAQRVWDIGVENSHLLTVNGNLVANSAVHDGTMRQVARPFLQDAVNLHINELNKIINEGIDEALNTVWVGE